MDIKLKWVNRNTTPVTIKIYRNETQVPNEQLGDPIATLAGTATGWTDTTAVRRKTYYYTIETTDGNVRSYSLPRKIFADFNNGPGPRELIWGNSDYGYFGIVESTDFFSASEVAVLAQATLNSPPSNPVPTWHKWIRRGKICFVPAQPLANAVTVIHLYQAGLVHGMDNNGPWNPGLGTGGNVNQLRTIERGYDKFIVRLPTASDDRNNPSRAISSSGQTPAVRRYSEVSDLIYPGVRGFVPSSQRAPNTEYYVVASQQNAGRQTATCTMFGTTGTLQGTPSTAATTGVELEAIGGITTWATSLSWTPILEMVPQLTVEI